MILILTYAKVCTTSLHHLLTERFPGDVFRSHGLEDWIVSPLERFVAATPNDATGLRVSFDNAPIRNRLAQARATGEAITLISGVRDPIAHSLSVAMQNLDLAFSDCINPSAEASAKAIAARVADLWLRDTIDNDPIRAFLELMIRAPVSWFAHEIHKAFGFDLRANAFDHSLGYSILHNDNVRLLLFRHESAPTAIENGLAQLYPEMDVVLPHYNSGLDKPSGEIYRALQKCFRLPRSVLEGIYAYPEVRAYYSEEEINSFIDRWAVEPLPNPACGRTTLPAEPRVTFAATVFIPVRNHAQWIGKQIDSLLAQWRPDVELLLVDDGSQDGSLGVALERLASRPEVAATLMRNSKAIGHGMLSDVISVSHSPVIIQADSDDITLPGRLDTIIHQFSTHPDCKLVTSNAVLISESGLPIGLLDIQSPNVVINDPVVLADQQHNNYWLGASSAFHRSIIEDFAPLDPELCSYGLDLLTGFRAALLGSQRYLASPLVGWRQHSNNSHRLIGTLNPDPVAQEHVAAIHLMTRAQRLRDVSWLEAHGKLDPARAAEITVRWRADFMTQVDAWIRLRNRLTGTHASPQPKAFGESPKELYTPAIPPILTLQRCVDYPISQIGKVLSRWAGMHQSEETFIWTNRQVVIVLRIPDPEAKALVITLRGLNFISRQSIYLSLDFARPIEEMLTASKITKVTVPIIQRQDNIYGSMSLMISVPEAASPFSFDREVRDHRVLGVALLAMKVI
jgi:glycosyltransferase involved in cell wall biosynthesis